MLNADTLTKLTEADHEALKGPVIQDILRLIRAEDRSGAYENEPDTLLLSPFILPKEERRLIPLFGDPDPDTLWRVDLYYQAIAMGIERATRQASQPLMKIHHEGWGRVVVLTGKLISLSTYVRELHRFGFDSPEQLAKKAQKLIDEGVATIEKFPEVASA